MKSEFFSDFCMCDGFDMQSFNPAWHCVQSTSTAALSSYITLWDRNMGTVERYNPDISFSLSKSAN